MEYIISFKNTNFAIKAEQCLLDQKLQVGVLPLPFQISAGCGICLRIKQTEIEMALKALANKQINEIGLHYRKVESGKFLYENINKES